jgi:hypothetical protein
MFINTLPATARQLLTRLGQEPLIRPFYLAGGSAVALYLGHRVSVDLDFFTHRDDYEVEPLTQRLRAIAEEDEPPEMLVSFNWSEVKRFFESEVRQLMQQL